MPCCSPGLHQKSGNLLDGEVGAIAPGEAPGRVLTHIADERGAEADEAVARGPANAGIGDT